MAKIRGIKPETWTDERFVSVSPLARLLFIGMWNFACDNGHLDDSATQLRMRILPADNCDAGELLAELIGVGLVERRAGFVKVPNLPEHQKKPDKRWITLCPHCSHDEDSAYTADDTASTRRVPDVAPKGARRDHAGDGDGDGDGETTPDGVVARKRATRIPEPFIVTADMRAWAASEVPGLDVDRVTRTFVDYWRGKSGRDATKQDWPATWRNWLRRDHDNHRGVTKLTRDDENLAVVARLAAREQLMEGIEA
jgi:hypothetical protein